MIVFSPVFIEILVEYVIGLLMLGFFVVCRKKKRSNDQRLLLTTPDQHSELSIITRAHLMLRVILLDMCDN